MKGKRGLMAIAVLVGLAVANFAGLAFLTGFGAGLTSAATPSAYALVFVGAAVMLMPVNLVALHRIVEWAL